MNRAEKVYIFKCCFVSGDPYTNCVLDPCSTDPCGKALEFCLLKMINIHLVFLLQGDNAIYEAQGNQAICKCPPQHTGDPYLSCR